MNLGFLGKALPSYIKKTTFIFLLASAAYASGKSAWADPVNCEDRVELEARQIYRTNQTLGRRLIQSNLRRQVRVIQALNGSINAQDRRDIEQAQQQNTALPAPLELRFQNIARRFNSQECGRGKTVVNYGDGSWGCRPNGVQSDERDEALLVERLLQFDIDQATACSSYTLETQAEINPNSPDSTPATTYDIKSCTVVDLVSGEIIGTSLLDSINDDVVGSDVHATVNEMPLNISEHDFIAQEIGRRCRE